MRDGAPLAFRRSFLSSTTMNDAITVEINPVSRQVVQARGPCNRQADSEEQQAIRLWISSVVRPDMAKQTNPAANYVQD